MIVDVSKEVEFDAGHRVPDHGSKCRNPHGHRYRVRATCSGPIIDEPGNPANGMVVDFGDLKKWLTVLVHDRFDHGFIVYENDHPMIDALARLDQALVIEVPYVPTAENIARDIFERLGPVVRDHWRTLRLETVEVWETPTSLATVRR